MVSYLSVNLFQDNKERTRRRIPGSLSGSLWISLALLARSPALSGSLRLLQALSGFLLLSEFHTEQISQKPSIYYFAVYPIVVFIFKKTFKWFESPFLRFVSDSHCSCHRWWSDVLLWEHKTKGFFESERNYYRYFVKYKIWGAACGVEWCIVVRAQKVPLILSPHWNLLPVCGWVFWSVDFLLQMLHTLSADM